MTDTVAAGVGGTRATGGWARDNALKTHCNEGHAFDGDNVKLRSRIGYVERVCRWCYRADKRDARAARRRA